MSESIGLGSRLIGMKTMKTTVETVTQTQIQQLAREARSVGDDRMHRICLDAMLGGHPESLRACVDAINSREAMVDK